MNTKITYAYANERGVRRHSEVLCGALGADEKERIVEGLGPAGPCFVPEQVGLPALTELPGPAREEPHHSLEALELTDQEPTLDLSASVLAERFSDAIRFGWRPEEVPHAYSASDSSAEGNA